MTTIKTEKRIATLESCMGEVQKDISDINSNLNNHVNSLTSTVNDIKTKIETVSNDMAWIKKFFWIAVTAIIGVIVTNIMSLTK